MREEFSIRVDLLVLRIRSSRFMGEEGLTLADSLIAVAILTIGIVSYVQLFPAAAKVQVESKTATAANFLALSKVEELRGLPYSSIPASASGDFSSLIGTANFQNVAMYSWHYTSVETLPGIQKKIELGIDRPGLAGTDSYIMYVVDFENTTP